MPVRCCRSTRSSTTAACTETSSDEVISSQITSFGLAAKARAMATRCFSPPESWCGIALGRGRGQAHLLEQLARSASRLASPGRP